MVSIDVCVCPAPLIAERCCVTRRRGLRSLQPTLSRCLTETVHPILHSTEVLERTPRAIILPRSDPEAIPSLWAVPTFLPLLVISLTVQNRARNTYHIHARRLPHHLNNTKHNLLIPGRCPVQKCRQIRHRHQDTTYYLFHHLQERLAILMPIHILYHLRINGQALLTKITLVGA